MLALNTFVVLIKTDLYSDIMGAKLGDVGTVFLANDKICCMKYLNSEKIVNLTWEQVTEIIYE